MLSRANIEECLYFLRMAHMAGDDVIVKEQIEYIYRQLERELKGQRSRFNGERIARFRALQAHGTILSDRSGQEPEGIYREVQYRFYNSIYCVCSLNNEIITIGKVREE